MSSPWQPPGWLDASAQVAWRILVLVAAFAVVVAGLSWLSVIVLPIALGILVATLLWPAARWLRGHGLPPAVASLLVVFGLVLVLGLVLLVVVNVVVDQWSDVITLVQRGLDEASDLIANAANSSVGDASDLVDASDGAIASIGRFLLKGLVTVIPIVVEIVSALGLTLVVLFFILKDGDKIPRLIPRFAPDRAEFFGSLFEDIWSTLTGFMVGQTAVAATSATILGLGSWIIGIPHAGVIAALAFVLGYIPFFGSFISGTFAVLLGLASGGLGKALVAVGLVVVVELVESNVLQPLLIGRSVELHPLVVLLSVVAGGAIAGILGAFLAVPVVAVGIVAFRHLRDGGFFGTTVTEPGSPTV